MVVPVPAVVFQAEPGYDGPRPGHEDGQAPTDHVVNPENFTFEKFEVIFK